MNPEQLQQERLKRSPRQLREVVDAAADGLVLVDADGRIELINRAARQWMRILGRDVAEGMTVLAAEWSAVNGTGDPVANADLPPELTRCTGQPLDDVEVGFSVPGGDPNWVSISTRPLNAADGLPCAVVVSAKEVNAAHEMRATVRSTAERQRAILEALHEGVVLSDAEGHFEAVNQQAEELLGAAPSSGSEVALPYRNITILNEDGNEIPADEIPAAIAAATGEPALGTVLSIERRDGQRQWLSVNSRPATIEGRAMVVSSFMDVTDRQLSEMARSASERRLAEAEQRSRSMFSMAPIGMGIVRNGYVQQANQAWADIVGRSPDELVGHMVDEFTYPGDPATSEAAVFLGEGSRSTYRVEKRYMHAEGHAVWVQVDLSAVRDRDGSIQYVIVQVQDIAERRRHQQQLEHIADHDALTGLLNRRGFQQALEDHVRHAGRYGADGAMLMLDLDHFKYVNDTLGHKVGDELIVKAAALLAGRLRESDIVARIGGDEFAILVPHSDRDAATTLATALLTSLREWRLSLDPEHHTAARGLTASIGIAMCVPDASADDLVVNADLAMYDAKEGGRDRWAFYTMGDGGEQPRMKARLSWLARVRWAIEERAFELFAQPIVDLRGSSDPMYEVLLRLRSDTGELISPSAFLSIAERVDLIQEIDRLVMEQSIAALGNTTSPVILSVNVSGKSVGDPELPALIERQLHECGVSPAALVIEITETAAISQIEQARLFATELQRLGCRLAIDDFGAGFGSFTYLKHIPFDFLKIDGEFVAGAVQSRADAVIIEAVRHMAHGLDRAVIGEHCSNAELVELLRRKGVDFAQGYHLGRPEPLDDVMRRNRRDP